MINKDDVVIIRVANIYDPSVDLQNVDNVYAYFEYSPMYHVDQLPQDIRFFLKFHLILSVGLPIISPSTT